MLQKCRKMLRNEKGLTLIELLAVVVILGIIAAIAVPSIGNIIDNSKKDAHVANAEQVINAARMAILNGDITDGDEIGIDELDEYLESMDDPDGEEYDTDESYINVADEKVTHIKLVNDTRGLQDADKNAVSVDDLKRESVIDNE